MNHGRELNRRIRETGVIWHQCSGCGLNWPFPKGSPDERDWYCHSCVYDLDGRVTRNVAAELTKLEDILKSGVTSMREDSQLEHTIAVLKRMLGETT